METMAKMQPRPRIWGQILGALSACLSGVSLGTCVAISSALVYSLEKGEDGLKMTFEEASWIPTLFLVGETVGCMAGGWISTFIGRRLTLLIFGIPTCASWFLLSFSSAKWAVYAVRFLMGLASSVAYVNIGVYISETAHKSVRNAFGAFQSISLTSGFLLAYLTGHFLEWRTAAQALSLVPLLASLAMLLLPETPYWLVEHGKEDEARKSMCFFRGPDYDGLEQELSDISDAKRMKQKELECVTDKKSSSIMQSASNLMSGKFLRPFSCIGVIYIIYQLSGFEVVYAYTENFFEESGVQLEPSLAALLAGSFSLLSSCMAPLLLMKVPKKMLFIACGACSCVGMSSVAIFTHLKADLQPNPDILSEMSWVPLVGATIATCCQNLGISSVVYIVLSESFPTDIRTASVGIVHCLEVMALVVNVKCYPLLTESIGFPAVVYIYSTMIAVMTVWGALTIKNTDGLTLVEVERMYAAKK